MRALGVEVATGMCRTLLDEGVRVDEMVNVRAGRIVDVTVKPHYGLPYDAMHGTGNFVIMLFLYRPLRTALRTIKRQMQL